MAQFLRFQPLYQERVWGGRVFESALGRRLPAAQGGGGAAGAVGGAGHVGEVRHVGEAWEIVDRPEAQSVVRGGKYDGMTIRALIEQHAAGVMGPGWEAARAFPILVKWLDCRERLSLQVHPPASVAAELGGEPKTENWYIAECAGADAECVGGGEGAGGAKSVTGAGGANLIVGLRRGVTREEFERALKNMTLEECVHRFPVRRGDSILVRSGQIHAIDGGNLILEIQQNSDTTYRVYDWGRVGLDGKPRRLHVAESLASIKWDDFEPAPVRGERRDAVIADAREFRIRRVPLARGGVLRVAAGEQARILSVVEGRVRETLSAAQGAGACAESGGAEGILLRGDNVVLPYAGGFVFEAEEDSLLLLTENFS
ncbi:MAG: class I mannose-6-phosphate isomerase [Opitutaceae bacterium]|nr:class I mannose-6-phosphate isomerase [Opitutaceae bacterium]